MRLERSTLPTLCRSIVRSLTQAEAIEVSNAREVEKDLESVLRGYLDALDQAASRARDVVQQRGLPQGEFARAKRLAAEQAGIKVGDEALDYVLDQLVSMLMHSAHVEEVFAEDHELKRNMRTFIRSEESSHDDLEAEVRAKLKHVQEGSRLWEIEYARMKEEIKRRRGLS